jgi:hypothetical protein
MFDEIVGGPFALDELKAPPGGSSGGGATSKAEREQEIRQLVEAKNNRRVNRGERPIDVDAEVDRLLALDPESDPDSPPMADNALREEVRGMVLARNRRREAKGEPPLDVDAEIERQLRDVGAL